MKLASPGAVAAHLTREELAERLKVSVRTIDQAVATGAINPVRFGRAVRFSIAEVERIDREGFSL
ncbi:MAG: helix-turn-helix domain-containing protein [Planctomycetota bacterium]